MKKHVLNLDVTMYSMYSDSEHSVKKTLQFCNIFPVLSKNAYEYEDKNTASRAQKSMLRFCQGTDTKHKRVLRFVLV